MAVVWSSGRIPDFARHAQKAIEPWMKDMILEIRIPFKNKCALCN